MKDRTALCRPARRWAPSWRRAVELANTYAWQSRRKYRVRRAGPVFVVERTGVEVGPFPCRRDGRYPGVEPRACR